jgi:uncharacterized protein (TIGR02453 family)
VFRIFRDVRFSKDKSPYKTHIGGYVRIAGSGEGGGDGPSATAPLYVHIGVGELFVAGGHYMMAGDDLIRFREALLDDARGGPLASMLKALAKRGFTVGSYDALKKVPRGIDPAHPRAELLKRKGLIVSFPPLPKELLVSPKLVDWLVKHTKQAAPVVEWLALAME